MMKKTDNNNDIEVSYRELKGLELHFKQTKKDALMTKLKKTPLISIHLMRKAVEGTGHGEALSGVSPEPVRIEPGDCQGE